jgi:DNA-binding SARP family transcriptional activator
MIRFQLLGPVEFWTHDKRIDLGPARQRTVLAALLIEPEQPISIDRLVDRVWADSPPPGVRNVIYTYITRLRRALAATGEAAVHVHRDNVGYRLSVSKDQVDLHLFGTLMRRARAASPDDPRRGALLREALQLWHGEALAGLDNEWVSRFRRNLQQLKNEALAEWADAELRAGRGAAVIQELRHALVQEPMAELLHEQLVRALHHTGQRAEALSQFERARRIIADELGSDPGPGLQDTYRRILAGERPAVIHSSPSSSPSPTSSTSSTSSTNGRTRPAPVPQPPQPQPQPQPTGPDLLPVGLADFAGRDVEVDELCRRLATRDRLPPITVLVGGAGVGKTALAVHAAHRAGEHFPHARLYVNLHGSDGRPVPPAVALTRLLRALGEDVSSRIHGLDELAEAYRSRVSGKRVLVVLDDAADDGQVTPLLPSGPGCAALVTSRSLSIRPVGARVCHVRGLGPTQAVELLARMVGEERVRGEEAAARRLAEICAGLPLALRALANRLVARPHWTLGRLVARVADEERRLDELSYGSLDVRGRLGSACRRLSPDAASVFMRLGTRADSGAVVVQEVFPELTHEEAEDMLEQLVDAHLLQATGHDAHGHIQYRLDELHRLFARSLAMNAVSHSQGAA